MTSPWELRFVYLALGLAFGALLGLGWGRFVDRDMEPAVVEIMQFVDGDKFDLTSHGPVYQTTPPVVRSDPEEGESK